MNESIISVRYTKALFLLAKDKGLLNEVKTDMEIIFSVMSENDDLKLVFQNPVLKPTKKQEIVSEIFSSFNNLTISFINLLIKNRRENHLYDISRNFLTKYRKDEGIETGVFTTAVAIDTMILDNVKSMIKKALLTEIELTNKIDKNILGGFIIRVGDKQVDSSVKTSLSRIKKKMLNVSVD